MPGVFPCGDGFCTEDSALEGWGGFLYYLASLGNWIQVFSLYTFYYLDAIQRDKLRHVKLYCNNHPFLRLAHPVTLLLSDRFNNSLKSKAQYFISKHTIPYPPRHAMIPIA